MCVWTCRHGARWQLAQRRRSYGIMEQGGQQETEAGDPRWRSKEAPSTVESTRNAVASCR